MRVPALHQPRREIAESAQPVEDEHEDDDRQGFDGELGHRQIRRAEQGVHHGDAVPDGPERQRGGHAASGRTPPTARRQRSARQAPLRGTESASSGVAAEVRRRSASAIATSAIAVTTTVSDVRTQRRTLQRRSDAPAERIQPGQSVTCRDARPAARSATGAATDRARDANRATEPASVSALNSNVGVKPCQRLSASSRSGPVTDSPARAIGPAASAGRTPRTTPSAPRTSGPSHSAGGASWDGRCRRWSDHETERCRQ